MTPDGAARPPCRCELYEPSIEAWREVGPRIAALEREAFGEGAFDAGYLEGELSDAESVVVLLRDATTEDVVGFTYAAPIDLMEEGRDEEWDETAYVADTVIAEDYRGRGLVGVMMEELERELRRRGYRFLERDAAVGSGYAARIERAYGDRIIARGDPHPSPWGPQVHFRIAL